MSELQRETFDRMDVLRKPAFWTFHFYEQTFDDHNLEHFFVDGNVTDFCEREFPRVVPGKPEYYPCYRLALPATADSVIAIEYAFYPGDASRNLYLHRKNWPSELLLCQRPSGHDSPPLRWDEAMKIVKAIQVASVDNWLHIVALPLIFPFVCLVSKREVAAARLTLQRSWSQLRVVHSNFLEVLVDQIVEQQRDSTQWREDCDLGWVREGSSLRNPEYSNRHFLGRVAEFFAGI